MYTVTPNTKRLQALGILPSEPMREKELNRFGVMVWDHKTGGSCQVLSGSSFMNARKYMALPGHRSGIRKYKA
jgi:hypothetical protein